MQHILLERNCQLAFIIIIIIIILFYLNPTYNQSTLPVGDSHKEKGKQIKFCWTEELKVKMIKVLWWRRWLFSLGDKNERRALSDGGDTFRGNPSQRCCLLAMSLIKLPTLRIGCELHANFWLSVGHPLFLAGRMIYRFTNHQLGHSFLFLVSPCFCLRVCLSFSPCVCLFLLSAPIDNKD